VLTRFRRVGTGVVVGFVVGLIACHAWGQEPSPSGTRDQPPAPVIGLPPTLPSPGPPLSAYPLELFGLLAPPSQRGPMTLFPSISISEEYNDNVHLDNQNRQWDFITNISPAITLAINQPSYQLSAGYTFTGQLYAREPNLNQVFQSQNFVANGSYGGERGLTLTASDFFAYNQDTSLVSANGFSTGRERSLSNTFTPGLAWQMTQLNTLSLSASYYMLRFLSSGGGIDSDTYTVNIGLTHAFTPRLSGNIGYGITYLKDHSQENSTVSHLPSVGLSYQLTRTLTASASGGPAITTLQDFGGETIVSPALNLSLTQALQYGSANLQYSSGVGVAGGFGGTNLTQSLSGSLVLSGWERGLTFVVNPVFSTADSLSSGQSGQVDVKTFTMTLGAIYQIWRFTSIFGGYTFLWQRTGASSSTQVDANQNTVRFGLQFGYPINFD
jgi:hypothetical protein